VLAIGNPLGFDFTVTAGIISAKGRSLPGLLSRRGDNNYSISDLIQTDAAINPGNSGGPLVNQRGEVIGITSAIASPTGVNAGYGFAIPITLARKVMDDIIKHGKVRVGVLGILIREVTPEDAAVAGMKDIRGAKVDGFNPSTGSGAERAGMQAGDVIITADGHPVDRVSTLQRIIRDHEPGEKVQLEVMRYGQKKSFAVTLTELAETASNDASPTVAGNSDDRSGNSTAVSSSALGISVRALPADMARSASVDPSRRGVLVTDVVPLGPSFQKLGQQDVIFEILFPGPRRPIRSVADLQAALSKLKDGDYVSLNVHNLAAGAGDRVVNIRIGGCRSI
jgi:serine protease Do